MRLTLQARRSIRLDSELNKLNLGVEVKNGVAHVWGPVPDGPTARRAVSRLETVVGIVDVRTDFHIRKAPVSEMYASRKVEMPLPGGAAAPSDGVTRKEPAAPQAAPAPRPSAMAGAGGPAPPAERPSVTTVRREGPTLAERIARARKSDPRFADVAILVEGASITVFRGGDDEAASLFAQKLGEVPGVSEVLLSNR
jgi:hypothetical protein